MRADPKLDLQPHPGPYGGRRPSFLLKLMDLIQGKNKLRTKRTCNNNLREGETFDREMKPLRNAGMLRDFRHRHRSKMSMQVKMQGLSGAC